MMDSQTPVSNSCNTATITALRNNHQFMTTMHTQERVMLDNETPSVGGACLFLRTRGIGGYLRVCVCLCVCVCICA
jgi:hypothetical protein